MKRRQRVARPDGKTHEADNEQDEARGGSTDSSAHSTQGRFPGMTISDELLQMIEKMSEKPNKERTITTAQA